jgi:hypothetical protein
MPRRRLDGNSDFGKGSITANYRGHEHLDDTFQVKNFTNVTWIEGRTLKRYWEREDLAPKSDLENIVFCLVYTPSDLQVDNGCDRCITWHHQKRAACSMNTTHASPSDQEGTLYSFTKRGRPIYTFQELDEGRLEPPGRASIHGAYIRLFPI